MKKLVFIFLLIPLFCFSQVYTGDTFLLEFDRYTYGTNRDGGNVIQHFKSNNSWSMWYCNQPGEKINEHLPVVGINEFAISDYATNELSAHGCRDALIKLNNDLYEYGIKSHLNYEYVRPGYWTMALYIDDYYIIRMGYSRRPGRYVERDEDKYKH